MNRVELEGVLAHELSHIKNYDILVSTLAVTMVGVVALLADIGVRMLWWGGGRRTDGDSDNGGGGAAASLADPRRSLLLILAPLVAQAHAGRGRAAGASRWPTSRGVELTRYPPGLISALEKLRDD